MGKPYNATKAPDDTAWGLNCLLSYRIDRNLFLISSFSFISYDTVYQCKQSIISAASYIHARMNLCSTLSVEDVAGFYKLSVSSLRTQSLRLGITSVLCRTNSLFMSKKTEDSFSSWYSHLLENNVNVWFIIIVIFYLFQT